MRCSTPGSTRSRTIPLACLLTLASAATRTAVADDGKAVDRIDKPWIEAVAVSVGPDGDPQSYAEHGRVGGMVGARLGLCVGEDRQVDVLLEPRLRDRRLVVELTTTAEGDEPRVETIDLSDFRPRAIDVAEDDDGTAYHLSLVPSIHTTEFESKSFRVATDALYQLGTGGAPVLLDDATYIGRVMASGADVVSLDVCGTASVEFSLYRLKGAEPLGVLRDGRLTLRKPGGPTLDLAGVTNGSDNRTVAGGPYTVWVRWREPSQSIAEYRASLEAMRDRVEAGEFGDRPGMRELLEQELAREPGPWVVSSSARGVRNDELVPESP